MYHVLYSLTRSSVSHLEGLVLEHGRLCITESHLQLSKVRCRLLDGEMCRLEDCESRKESGGDGIRKRISLNVGS